MVDKCTSSVFAGSSAGRLTDCMRMKDDDGARRERGGMMIPREREKGKRDRCFLFCGRKEREERSNRGHGAEEIV